MNFELNPKVQLNASVCTNAEGEVTERTMLINVRTNDVQEASNLFNQLRLKLNGAKYFNPDIAPKHNQKENENTAQEKLCPSCGGRLVLRSGRNGKFYGCSRYRSGDCKHTEPA